MLNKDIEYHKKAALKILG